MDIALPPTNGFFPVRVCSVKHCKTIINVSKGNVCQPCVARMGFTSSASASQNAPNNLVAPPKILPGALDYASLGPDLFAESTNSGSHTGNHSFGFTSVMAPGKVQGGSLNQLPQDHRTNMSGAQIGLSERASLAIPHQQRKFLRVPGSAPLSREAPASRHFNSRGELIVGIDSVANIPEPENLVRSTLRAQEGSVSNTSTICKRCRSRVPARFCADVCSSCRFEVSRELQMNSLRTKLITPDTAKLEYKKDSIVTTEVINVSRDTLSISDDVNGAGGNFDTENLELAYPEPSDITTEAPVLTARSKAKKILPNSLGPRNSLQQPYGRLINPSPSKRRKTSNDSSTSPKSRRPPILVHSNDPAANPGSIASGKYASLKLCSTASCTGIISTDSAATRCVDCIKSNWTSQRAKLSSAFKDSKEGIPIVSALARSVSKTGENKKAVTWADQVNQESSRRIHAPIADSLETEKFALGHASISTSTPTPVQTTKFANISEGGVPDSKTGEMEFHDDQIAQDTHLPLSSNDAAPPQGGRASLPSPPTSKAIEPIPTETFSMDSLPASNPEIASGWESDLTDLSDDTESEGSFSGENTNIKTQLPSTSTGLKIRIPARPGGVYAPKCASLRCNQTLGFGYKWKTCVLCRARSREYQRRRQNIQGGHIRLEQELNQAQSGTSMSRDLMGSEDTKEKEPTLIPGARLCSVRDCSYIVPPSEEYRWKMCALCRLRRREHRKKVKQQGATAEVGPPESEAQAKHAQMLLKLTSPLFTAAKRPDGRCQSLDCGMLITDSKSTQCEQCITRRIWLMKRSGHYPSGLDPSRNYAEKPLNFSPYTKFKGFSALLLQFKNRLSGFLHVQSLFFLFRRPDLVKSVFAFDGEYSVCALDFDLHGRKEEIDSSALRLKREIEHVGRIKFSPKRLVSILDGGGIAVRFGCTYPAPILQTVTSGNQASMTTASKHMQCELEIASLPDYSHRFIPGQRTIIRFRLLG